MCQFHQGRFRLGIFFYLFIIFFLERVVKHPNRLPRAVVESASLETFERCVDEDLRDMV